MWKPAIKGGETSLVNDQNGQSSDGQPFLEPIDERVIEGVDVYVAGLDDEVASGRTLNIQESTADRWVGAIDANLSDYADVKLEIRLPLGVAPRTAAFVVGPRVRDETLISGIGPAPKASTSPSVRQRPRIHPLPPELNDRS